MKMKRAGRNAAALVMVLLLVLFAACAPIPREIPPTPTPAEQSGIIEIRVTDPPPADVKSAIVHLSNIEVHKVSDNGSGWITISKSPPSFDLMAVIGVTEFLGSETVTAGKFTQIRMDVEKVEVTIATGNTTTEITAEVPSGKLKIVRPFTVEPGMTTVLTLDFDGKKSLILPGKDIAAAKERALFKPVVKLLIEHEGEGEGEGVELEGDEEEEAEGELEEVKTEAREAIRETEEELAKIQAKAEEAGVTLPTDAFAGFNSLLSEAKSAFEAENYEEAKSLAEQAEETLEDVEKLIEELKEGEEESPENQTTGE